MLQNDLTKRVILVYNYLIEKKVIDNKSDFCRRVHIRGPEFTLILNGKYNFPDSKVHQLIRAFYLNVNYIMFGTGSMFWYDAKYLPIKLKKVNTWLFRYKSFEDKSGVLEVFMN